MDAVQYQGLFYLSAGLGSFVSLLLGLRLMASKFASPALHAPQPGEAWKGREELELIEVIAETHDVKSFRLRRLGGQKIPPFAAGQFLSFQIANDEKLLRSYSLSQGAQHSQLVQVSIKRLADGIGSRWFHDLSVGSRVWAYPPAGRFTDGGLADQERVYIAGGIGITPMLAMIETNLASATTFPMTLFYGMRTCDDKAFHDLFSYWGARHSRFSYFPVVSSPSPDWSGDQGLITVDFLKAKLLSSTFETAHFFLCGPIPMTDALLSSLAAQGVADERVHVEKFASSASFDRTAIPERRALVKWEGKAYPYRGQKTLLEFLEGHGIELAFACRTGVCGTCKCLAKGKVEAISDAGLTSAEKRQGMILPCVAFPLEDVELSL